MYWTKILVISLIVLFINGCTAPNFGQLNKGDDALEEETFIGNDGLVLSFQEGSPPREVYADTSFDIIVEMHNRGALNIDKGTARLNIPKYFGVEGKKLSLMGISGKDVYPGGEMEQIKWEGIKSTIAKPTKNYNAVPTVHICYEGTVIATPIVCISPRAGGPILEGECKVGRKTYSEGFGGPVTVSSITENVVYIDETDNQMRYRIEFKNVGGGDIIDRGDKVNACSLGESDKKISEIEVEVGWSEGNLFTCTSSGDKGTKSVVIMREGEGSLACESDKVPNADHYSLPLYIKMDYGYVESIKKSFTLKKEPYTK